MCECPICKRKIKEPEYNDPCYIYSCDWCGKYIISKGYRDGFFKNEYNRFIVQIFLFYHKMENRILFIGEKSLFDYYKANHKDSEAILYTFDEILNWLPYPHDFYRRINLILQYLAKNSRYDGSVIKINNENKYLIFLCDTTDDKENQFEFIYDYLLKNDYIRQRNDGIQLLPKGYEEIYEYEKNPVNLKNAFVAMKFGNETNYIREAIRAGIKDAGYIAVYIDEKIHNHQIVPVMLDEIRNSRFLVMDCTYNNLGAYYEAGIALGLGKEVIITCKNETLDSENKERPHFDIAQKQILYWDTEEELKTKLTQWINAVIKK